jgi:cytosine/adenosine deaminase-related metal-dependent hydrolase/ubiquinone/menaquinone biosynthesis C-methylase UbiE
VSVLTESVSAKRHLEAFSAWADVYDEQKNPLLNLEERLLLELLPKVQGRDVLDVGCGTGRWLAKLDGLRPHSLHGVDPSPEMLQKAAAKNIADAQLSVASCESLPAKDAAFDILLASFVLSYVDDLRNVATELARVARPGADLFLSDMHPATATTLRWKRSFRGGSEEIELPAISRSIPDILDAFQDAGFIAQIILEPSFGDPEKSIFMQHHRLERFAEAECLPAIYLLHLYKQCSYHPMSLESNTPVQGRILDGCRCALSARAAVAASVHTHAGQIQIVSSKSLPSSADCESKIDLSGYLLLPGLVNAHDHLELSLFPRLGRGPYENAAQWAQDIQQNDAATIATYRRIPKAVRLWWGGIRNLLSGVTTVCHHNPMDPLLLAGDFPVRVLSRFGWDHSLSFGGDVRAARNLTPKDEPFVIHACEGIDEQSKMELQKLDELRALDRMTVLVHGLALDAEGAALLDERGAALVTCPSSNRFLFRRVVSREILESISQLALGSDSSLTAAGDLLDEIRFAAAECGLSPQRLYSLVTDSAASVLRLREGEGLIRPGAGADLIAVKDRPGEPAEVLGSLTSRDIELVLLSDRVQLASPAIFEGLSTEDRRGLEPLSVDGDVRWLRAPVHDLLWEAEQVLGEGAVRLGGKLVCLSSL